MQVVCIKKYYIYNNNDIQHPLFNDGFKTGLT